MRLLVTRPEPGASAMADELRNLGHEPILQPLLEFHTLDFDPAPLRKASALIFTSGNALRALHDKLDPREIADCPVFCAGSETARRAFSAGFRSVAATAGTAEELAGKIVSQAERGAKLIHVTGEHQAFDLGGALTREGFSVCTLRTYEMNARKAFEPQLAGEMNAGGIGGVILMSPRTASIFVSLCQLHQLLECAKNLHYFCLATSVARMLKPLGAANVHIAAKPDRASLLALLAGMAARPPIPSSNAVNGK